MMSGVDSGRGIPEGEEGEKAQITAANTAATTTTTIANTTTATTTANTTTDGEAGIKDEKEMVNGDITNNNNTGENREPDITELEIDEALANISVPSDEERNQLFEKGLKLDKEGKGDQALKYYLKCLAGLREESKFALLPQCLRNIADIYYSRDDYDKAISFIKAEKLYYESVLVDSSELQKRVDEVSASGDGTDVNIDILRATEYEQLSKLCMDEKQPQLALEYAGKATKLRQKVYGDGHEEVQKSLDYFATVYAEVGKQQYSESLTKFDPADVKVSEGGTTLNNSDGTEPVSILRRRNVSEGGDKLNKHVSFDETQVPSEELNQREERVAECVLIILFVICLVILIILGLYIYCSISLSGKACIEFRHTVQAFVMKLRYWYYHYSSGKDVKYT